jgi:predicted RNA-binding protein with EMAP domain
LGIIVVRKPVNNRKRESHLLGITISNRKPESHVSKEIHANIKRLRYSFLVKETFSIEDLKMKLHCHAPMRQGNLLNEDATRHMLNGVLWI